MNSSLTLMANALIKELEIIKNPRIGIPLGKKTLGEQRPDQVEAKFGEYSLSLASANWYAIQKLYSGDVVSLSNGYGFDDLIEEPLRTDIENQIQTINQAFAAIPSESVQEALVSFEGELTALYDAIQGLVVLWKTDMMSELGLQINYQDNDGD